MFNKKNYIEMIRRQMPYWSEEEIQKNADFMEEKHTHIKLGVNVIHIRHLSQLVSKEDLKIVEGQLKLINYELSSFDESGIFKNSFEGFQSEVVFLLSLLTTEAVVLNVVQNTIWEAIKASVTFLWHKVQNKHYIVLESGRFVVEKKASFSLKLSFDKETTLEFNMNNVNNEDVDRCLDKALDYARIVKKDTLLKSHDILLYNNENKTWDKVVFTPDLLRAPSNKIIRKLTIDEFIREKNIK